MSDYREWGTSFQVMLAACAIAAATAGLSILLVTRDFETIPAGLLFSLFLLPSIILFVVLERRASNPVWKHVGYLIPVSVVLLYALSIFVSTIGKRVTEGGAMLAAIMAVSFGASAFVTYLYLLRPARQPPAIKRS